MAKLFYLVLIVTASTLWLYLLHLMAPTLSLGENIKTDIKFPSDLEELQEVAATLKAYSVHHWWYVLMIFSSAYVYKQAFCVPGSLFLNLLSGALYGHLGGLFFSCLFTGIGATVCYFLSLTFARDLVCTYFPKRFKTFQEKVKDNKNNLLYFMLFIRLVPIAPGWMINVVAPLVNIPAGLFFVTTSLGLIPYNFVGVSAGGMLASLKSMNDVFSWRVLLNISAIAVAALAPAYLLKRKSEKQKENIKATE